MSEDDISVDKEIINIIVSGEFGVKTLEGLIKGSLSEMGEQISLDVGSVDNTPFTRVNVRIRPDDVGRGIYETLKNIAENVVKCEKYQETMTYFGGYNKYLGNWDTERFPLKMDVGLYLNEAYRFAEEKWGVTREELVSKGGLHKISRVRGAIFYALKRKFPNGNYDVGGGEGVVGLSTVDIGEIFGKDHSTVCVVLKEIRKVLSEPKVKRTGVVGDILEEVVNALGGVK